MNSLIQHSNISVSISQSSTEINKPSLAHLMKPMQKIIVKQRDRNQFRSSTKYYLMHAIDLNVQITEVKRKRLGGAEQ